MKAVAVFPKEKKVALVDHPEPKVESSTEIKIKILDVGICGTDREICEFKYGTPPKGSDYLIIGHECLGQVVEVGSDVESFQIGDLVVAMVRRPCHHRECIACQVGQQDFCYTGDFTERGINQLHGFMTEYVVDEEKYFVHVPHSLVDIGVLAEPLTISEKAVREIFIIQKRLPWLMNEKVAAQFQSKIQHPVNYRALVIGAGPVGLLAAHVLVSKNFDTYVYSLEPATDVRARIATKLGATYLSAKDVTAEDLNSKISGNLDVVFDASGATKLSFEVINSLGYNSIFVWTGIPGRKEPLDINSGTIMRDMVLKNQIIVGCVNAAHTDFENAIVDLDRLNQKGEALAHSLITRFPVEKYRELLLSPPAPGTFKSALHFADPEKVR